MSAENVQGREQGWKLTIGAFAPGTRKEPDKRGRRANSKLTCR